MGRGKHGGPFYTVVDLHRRLVPLADGPAGRDKLPAFAGNPAAREAAQLAGDHTHSSTGIDRTPRAALSRFIDIDDSEALLRAIRLTPDNLPINLMIHTPGGLVLAAE